MTDAFNTFVARLTSQDNLAFGISFDGEAIDGSFPVTVGGITIPCVNELLVQEAWFFEKLAEITSEKRKEIKPLILALASKLQAALNLETLADARAILFSPSDEITENVDYQRFVVEYEDDLLDVFQMLRELASDFAIRLYQITFFLKSRLGDEWTLGRVARMRKSQLEAIEAVITKEMNGGAVPEEAMEDETSNEEAKEAPKK